MTRMTRITCDAEEPDTIAPAPAARRVRSDKDD